MRDIAHIKIQRKASLPRQRTGRAWIATAFTCAATLSLCLPGNTALAAGKPPVGHCRVVLRLNVAPAHRDQVGSRYESSFGTSSCTGSLGPWLMGGQTGWSTGAGTFRNVAIQDRRVTANGKGNFWAEAPRLAWFHPPTVTFTGAFRLHRLGDRIDLNGAGELLRTREAPIASSFTLTGTATLTLHHRRDRTAERSTGTLTLEFDIRNRA